MSEEQKREQTGETSGKENKDQESKNEQKDKGEIIDLGEPEKIILLALAGVTALFPIWRILVARKNRAAKSGTALSLLLLCLLALLPAPCWSQPRCAGSAHYCPRKAVYGQPFSYRQPFHARQAASFSE